MFKKDRKDFEKKWDDVKKVFIEYGMLTEQNSLKKLKIFLIKIQKNHYYTFKEFTEKIKEIQKNKEGKKQLFYILMIQKNNIAL